MITMHVHAFMVTCSYAARLQAILLMKRKNNLHPNKQGHSSHTLQNHQTLNARFFFFFKMLIILAIFALAANAEDGATDALVPARAGIVQLQHAWL